MLILVGERFDDAHEPLLALLVQELSLGVRRIIENPLSQQGIAMQNVFRPLIRLALPEGKVVGDGKDPARQIPAQSPFPQMPEQREEYLLKNFLSIVHG